MKRIAPMMLVLLMLFTTAFAESTNLTEEEGIQEATEQIQKWIDKLAFREESIQDEDSEFVTNSVLDKLINMKGIMMGSVNSQKAAPNSADDAYRYSRTTLETDRGITTALQTDLFVGSSGLLYSCNTEYTADYQQITLSVLDEQYRLIRKDIVELAQKGSETVIVMLNDDAGDESTIEKLGKFATWLRESDEETVYAMVFDSETNLRLKPKQWSEGDFEIEQWNADLLLPDKAQ